MFGVLFELLIYIFCLRDAALKPLLHTVTAFPVSAGERSLIQLRVWLQTEFTPPRRGRVEGVVWDWAKETGHKYERTGTGQGRAGHWEQEGMSSTTLREMSVIIIHLDFNRTYYTNVQVHICVLCLYFDMLKCFNIKKKYFSLLWLISWPALLWLVTR